MSPATVVAFFKEHPRTAYLVLGLALGAGVGYAAHRPPPAPAIALHEDTDIRKASDKDKTVHDSKGPVDEDWTFYSPEAGEGVPKLPAGSVLPVRPRGELRAGAPSVPCPVVATLRRHTGPEVIDTHLAEHSIEQDTRKLDLVITPPSSGPRFAVAVGLEDPLGMQSPHFEVGARVLTIPFVDKPLWVRIGNTPARGLVHGTTVMGEVQW